MGALRAYERSASRVVVSAAGGFPCGGTEPGQPVRTRFARGHAGFTLIELMVTVVIVGVLASLAVPAMQHMILSQDVRTAASDLQTSLYFARSEAIKRASNVAVVPASSDWKNGWTVQIASSSTVLRTAPALASSLSSMSGSTITYRSDGHVTSTPATIVITTANPNVQARCLKIDLSGRPDVNNYAYGGGTNTCS